ncbi:hypothetical protein [Brevibacterium album]|uniref:hypothetical protein n=1 Tax=Brevibacterium album TaxID=417948 RepID=UPI0003F9578B|nr:hypothetical protein [Brevibacterium album]
MTAHPTHVPQKPPSLVFGVVCLVAGALILAAGLLVLVTPMLLFLMGGGGNVEAFEEFARPVYTTGALISLPGLAVLAAGVVLVVIRRRARRRWFAARFGARR